ncbi:MAG: TolC family protein [Odoribacteraceae bacterium]|jgi:outer membrane protein TolC|nr:TolC family protein [Odoribacteraceae bacterium]
MARFSLFIIALLLSPGARAQLSLEECQARARANYPLTGQRALIERALATDLSNANAGYLPRVSLAARATYQSDVTRLPLTLPGVNVDGLSRDQYQLSIEINQSLWDGGAIPAIKRLTSAGAAAGQARLEVELRTLRERVNNLFFGILLADEQSRQNALLRADLERALEQISARVERGIVPSPEADAVRVELARLGQREIETRSAREACRAMLEILVGEEIDEITRPPAPVGNPAGDNRPEFSLFRAEREQVTAELGMLRARTRPRVGLFMQGGYGKPGLNMLRNAFTGYYIGGVRLSWDIGVLNTLRGERRQLSLRGEMVDRRRETFLVNLSAELVGARADVDRWRDLLARDNEIVSLRERIAESAGAAAQGGIASVLEWTREINHLDQARQARALHEIQWLQAIYALRQIAGD